MLDEQEDPINKYYERIVKMEQKLYNHLQILNKLVRNNETTGAVNQQNQQASGKRQKDILQYENKIDKFVKVANRDIESTYIELSQYLQQNNDLETRFAILTDSKKQLTQTIANLKQELHDNKSAIAKYKKLQNMVNSLTAQLRLQQSSVNKLQLAYNNALRLQNDMESRIRELQHQENQSSARFQWQNQREIQGEKFWKNSQKYQKLADDKSQTYKKLEGQVANYNKSYLDKFTALSALKTKIKGIDEIYEELQVNVNEQELIIKEILIKQGLSSSYLLQMTKKQNEGLNQSSDEQGPKNNIKINLQKFRRKIGMPNTPNMNGAKVNTEPVQSSQELKTPDKQASSIKNIMRLTTKLPQTQMRQRVKRASLQHENSNKIKRKSTKEVESLSIFLPPIQNNEVQSYFPISHNSGIPSRSRRLKKSKGSFSHQITHSKLFQNPVSQVPTENQDTMLLENHFVRIRTKGGYIYKNINDDSINTSRQGRGNRSEIVNLYQKLKHNQRFMTQSQADKTPEAYAKLSQSRKKGKQSTKKFIQTRQSDPENNQKGKLKLNVNNDASDKQKNGKKKDNDSDEAENNIEIRRRLNTIHQEQQPQDSRNNNK